MMVWMITVIGFTLNIPDTVMGLTFIAAGVSVPDALSGIAVIREGTTSTTYTRLVSHNLHASCKNVFGLFFSSFLHNTTAIHNGSGELDRLSSSYLVRFILILILTLSFYFII